MKLKTAQWDLNVEMTLKAKLMRLNMIVIDANYFTRSGDDSKLERIDAGWQNIKYLLLYRMDRIFAYVSLAIILFIVIFNYIYLIIFIVVVVEHVNYYISKLSTIFIDFYTIFIILLKNM